MRFKGLIIRPPNKNDPIKAYLDFITELIDEDTFLTINKKPTMKEQKAWFNERLQNIRRGREVFLTAWDGKRHIGNCHATKDRWKDERNVAMGLAIIRAYRGRGVGEKLLRETIRLAKEKLRPRNIYLRVFSDNKIAKSLYRKVGFRTLARFPNWTFHKGKYIDHDFLILKK